MKIDITGQAEFSPELLASAFWAMNAEQQVEFFAALERSAGADLCFQMAYVAKILAERAEHGFKTMFAHAEDYPQAAAEWRPIESAPKDGTRVAVKFEGGYEDEANYQTTYGGEWHVKSFTHLPWDERPTYWRPLLAALSDQPTPAGGCDDECNSAKRVLAAMAHRAKVAVGDEVRRNDDGTLDEIVGAGSYHLEQMHSGHWSLRLGRHLIGLHSKRAIGASFIENGLA